MMNLKLAFRNLLRNKRRTALTLASIISGVISLMVYAGFIHYSLWGLRESTIHSGLGHIQIVKNDQYFTSGSFDPFGYSLDGVDDIRSLVQLLPSVRFIVPQSTFGSSIGFNDKTGLVMIQAVPVNTPKDLLRFRKIIKGKDLSQPNSPDIVLGVGVAKRLGVTIGDRVTLLTATQGGGVNAMDVFVVGISKSGIREMDNIYGYMDWELARQFLFLEGPSVLIAILNNTETTNTTLQDIRLKLKQHGVTATAKPWHELADYYTQATGFFYALMTVIKGIVVLVSVFAIINTITMSVFERVREIGILRIMGSPQGAIITLFILEGLMLGLAGGIMGVIGGYGVSAILNWGGWIYIAPPPGMSEGYIAQFTPTFWDAIECVVLATGVSVLASIYPAWKASKISVADAIRFK